MTQEAIYEPDKRTLDQKLEDLYIELVRRGLENDCIREARFQLEDLKEKLSVEQRFRELSLNEPAIGHDYWKHFYQAKYEVAIAAGKLPHKGETVSV